MKLWPFGKKAQERPRRRRRMAQPVIQRAHNAARVDRLTADWSSMPVPVDSVLRSDLQSLRARSRHEAENDDYAARFLALLETNVIGESGIRPNPQVVGPDGEADVAMNEAIVRAWEEWGGAERFCDMGGRLTWQDMERLFVRTAAEDGEVLVQEVRGANAGPFGYALHFLDAELLDINSESAPAEDGSYARLGVQVDKWGRPTGYWLKDEASAGPSQYLSGYFGTETKFWSADDILHAFIVRRVGQKRGLPWMSTALFRMKMLSGLEDAAAVVARAGAAQMGAIQRDAGEDVPMDGEESEGGPRIIETEPGVFLELRPGETLQQYTPTYPAEQFDPFVKVILRGVASGVNVGYNTLANDNEGTNYSSMRSSKSDDNDAWRMVQRWTWRSFHQRVYRGFLEMAAMTGKLQPIDGRVVTTADAAAMASMVKWDARGWEAVDPAKEVTARVLEVEAGLRSRAEIIRARGGDPEAVWTQLTKESERLAGLQGAGERQDVVRALREALMELIDGDEDDEERGEA